MPPCRRGDRLVLSTRHRRMSMPRPRILFASALLLWACLLVALPADAMQAAAGAATAEATAPVPAAPDADDLRGRFDFAFDKLGAGLAAFVAWLPLLAVALLIVVFAAWLAGFVSRRLHLLRLRTDNPYMDGLIRNVVRVVIILSSRRQNLTFRAARHWPS